MRYLPHTNNDIDLMLAKIGAKSLEDLFAMIPDKCKHADRLDLPDALTEWELDKHIDDLAENMGASSEYKIYLGAGSYDHYIPASVSYLLSRSEFVTAYTPYQPEMSQGTLQAIYEYQTLTANLLGMEVANASLYDGASALAEALLMGVRISKKKKAIAISKAVHPFYRQVVDTYFNPTDYKIVELPFLNNGTTDLTPIAQIDDLAAVAVQSPNFFGCIEDLDQVGKEIHKKDALFITSFTEPLAYGFFKSPGEYDADIVCGQGQSFGIPKSFGGPGLGMFACKNKYVRSMPGRLVGKTVDKDKKRGFVLTLATREQHIRREKATSNICTNSSLCALCSSMYMASLGGTGIKELATLNYDKAEYLKKQFQKAGFKIGFTAPNFNEFVVEFPENFKSKYENLINKKIVPGLALERFFPELANHYLLCVTEITTKQEMDQLVKEVQA